VTRPLRAGMNAIFLEPGMGGLETYVLELVPALLEAEPSLELTLLCNSKGRELLERQPWSASVDLTTPRASRRGLRALYELGPLGITAGRRFDVLHSPALTAPLATRAANVPVRAAGSRTQCSRGIGASSPATRQTSAVPGAVDGMS